MSSDLKKWERAEVERSAAEASHIDPSALVSSDLSRYINPSADTVYPLEYSYYLLGNSRGLRILEYGCGDGENTAALAQRAVGSITSLDISPDLIGIARQRLVANGISHPVNFVVGSAHELPFPDESVDVVFGIAILHHLDLALASREVKRVLRKGGRAIFQEPVRNSRLLKLIRRLIPYRAPDVSPFERPLTDKELKQFAEGYSSYHSKAFQLPVTNVLNILPGLRERQRLWQQWDAAILKKIPAISTYASVRVIELIK
jgi:ubiquinone/menaquinone biosynthesis C-methylase UbiE